MTERGSKKQEQEIRNEKERNYSNIMKLIIMLKLVREKPESRRSMRI